MPKGLTIKERFVSKYSVDESTGCWNWTAAKGDDGYGSFSINNRARRAHRVSYEINTGPVPDGMHVCHRCDNPTCVNPAHLFLGDHAINNADMTAKGRNARGGSHGRAKITDADALVIRTSKIATRALSEKYSLSESQVQRIRSEDRWRSLTDGAKP